MTEFEVVLYFPRYGQVIHGVRIASIKILEDYG